MKPQISRVWFGPRPMPTEYVEYGRKWQELNPDWRVVDYSYYDLPPLINQNVVDDIIARDAGRNGIECFVQIADVVGYELAYRFSGIYVNVDIEPVRSMVQLFTYYQVEHSAYAPYEDDNFIVNCALGGPAEHPFWQKIIDELPERYFTSPGAEMNQTTGPRLLTDVVQRGGNDFIALSKYSFNAVHWSDIEFGGTADNKFDWIIHPGVIGIHHWGHRKKRRTNVVENASQ